MRLLAVALCLVVIAVPVWSRAQETQTPTVADQAAELKHRGDGLLIERRYLDALEAYDRSYALSPNVAIDYNRGRALQFLARYPEALDAYERFAQQASPDLRAKVAGLDDIIEDVRGKVATVKITVDGTPARVLIGGKDVGLDALKVPFRVNAGPTTIELLSDEYFEFRREVVLPAKVTTVVLAKLTRRDAYGYLQVRSTVAGTSAFVDGKEIGLVPAETALLPGPHPVRVAHDGYDSASTQVLVRVGEHRDLVLDPLKRKPVTSHWWFWGGLGAGVLAVTAIVVVSVLAATTEGSLPSGDFSPGQIRY